MTTFGIVSETDETEDGHASAEDLKKAAERVAASQLFRSSPRLRQLLLYIAECTARGAVEDLTEQQIGIHVFGRQPGYNSGDDNIVRSQVRQLRLRMENYYAEEGKSDAITLGIPKGHYLLSAQRRQDASDGARQVVHASASEEPPQPVQIAISTLEPLSALSLAKNEEVKARPVRPYVWALLFGALLASAWGLSSVLINRLHAEARIPAVWRHFIIAREAPIVIYSNAPFKGDPVKGLVYLLPNESGVRSIDTYTGIGEVVAVHELSRLFNDHGRDFILKRSMLVTWDEARSRDLIFIGSPTENLSLNGLTSTREFTVAKPDELPSGKTGIINKHPMQGEPAAYSRLVDMPPLHDYAIIGILPGLEPGKEVMVLSGLTTYSTEAAAEFMCRHEGQELIRSALASRDDKGKFFEGVLEVTITGGVPVESKLLTLHRRD